MKLSSIRCHSVSFVTFILITVFIYTHWISILLLAFFLFLLGAYIKRLPGHTLQNPTMRRLEIKLLPTAESGMGRKLVLRSSGRAESCGDLAVQLQHDFRFRRQITMFFSLHKPHNECEKSNFKIKDVGFNLHVLVSKGTGFSEKGKLAKHRPCQQYYTALLLPNGSFLVVPMQTCF